MLKPVTKKITDESQGGTYRFTFYCDICGNPWHNDPCSSVTVSASVDEKACERARDRNDAYERANHEAIFHFNRCPVCKRWVCQDCFRLLPEGDICKECMDAREK